MREGARERGKRVRSEEACVRSERVCERSEREGEKGGEMEACPPGGLRRRVANAHLPPMALDLKIHSSGLFYMLLDEITLLIVPLQFTSLTLSHSKSRI